MRIFIDEAGPFLVPPSAQSLFSLVLALVIPSCVEGELFAEFSQLRDGWSSQGGEVKPKYSKVAFTYQNPSRHLSQHGPTSFSQEYRTQIPASDMDPPWGN